MCFVLLRLIKKKFNMVLSFWQHCHHGRQKDFFHGGALGDFSKIFSGGGKSDEICVFALEIKKTTFFAKIFKIQGVLAPLAALFRCPSPAADPDHAFWGAVK